MKILLALQRRELSSNLHFTISNPNIAFDDLKLEVVGRRAPFTWQDLRDGCALARTIALE
jgi:acyl transferase domain-containing protein